MIVHLFQVAVVSFAMGTCRAMFCPRLKDKKKAQTCATYNVLAVYTASVP